MHVVVWCQFIHFWEILRLCYFMLCYSHVTSDVFCNYPSHRLYVHICMVPSVFMYMYMYSTRAHKNGRLE